MDEKKERASVIQASLFPWTAPHLLKLNYCTLSLVIFASANGYDSSMVNGLQSLPPWMSFMAEPAGAWLGFITIVYWVGLLLAYIISPSISNRYGRKVGLYIGMVLVLAGAVLQGLAPSPGAWIVGRALAGAAASFWSCNAPVLISEVAYPSHRAVVTSFYQSGYYIGSTLAAWIIYGNLGTATSWSWRIPSFLQLILPLCAFPGLVLCPESPRWLTSQGRGEEAEAIITRWHAAGDQGSALVQGQMAEIRAALDSESKLAASASYLDMFKTPGNRRRLLISVSLAWFAQWGGVGVVAFYLTDVLKSVGITQANDQLVITACLQKWNLLCAVIAACFMNRVGKRPLFHASAIVMLASYILITGLSGSFAANDSRSVGIAVVPFLFVYYAGYSVALTPLLTAYPCEIWQFNLRSKGLSLTWISSSVFAVFNSLVNPIALEAIGWKYYFVFLVVLLVYGATEYFLYPETKGYSLEQIRTLFDGDETDRSEGSEV
ncbi:general substrate transporter [Aspergillus sclerotiicarbonarius CBS 121057]|uniref:General substrate transporter n=1 Tax=Aspergillus sclerotiicarbonarius (strain CBS 121057 / IBT 28362) TaxID=1448318 RepID=A0A319FMR3_ASPSB|nr:general substrate transporter [Aspergillus sclerotiicarbonarius CBS 121057]